MKKQGLLFLIWMNVFCAVPEVSFQESFTLRVSVKRAIGSIEEDQNANIYVNRKSIPWQNKVLSVRLVQSDVYDNTKAVDSFCKQVNPDIYQSPNDFCFKNSGATQIDDPLNPDGSSNIFDLPALYEAATLLGTGESSQTIGLFDLQGVKEGVYDLIAFADTETTLEVNSPTPKDEDPSVKYCTCLRAGGCNKKDLEKYDDLKKKYEALIKEYPNLKKEDPQYGDYCQTLIETPGMIMPSNGDTFYVIDNVVVNSDTESRLKFLVLSLDSDNVLVNSKGGAGDGDVWDEWRCIYHIPELTGYIEHLYTFPTYDLDKNYCLPGSTGCSSGSGAGGSKRSCGTLMDFNLDYNQF